MLVETPTARGGRSRPRRSGPFGARRLLRIAIIAFFSIASFLIIVPADPETRLARCLGWLIRGDRYWPSRGARVRKRHGPPPAADAVPKAPFVPPLPTIKRVTNWAKLGQFPSWIKLGGATEVTQFGDGAQA